MATRKQHGTPGAPGSATRKLTVRVRALKPSVPILGRLERRILFLCTVLILCGGALVLRMPQHIAAMEEQRQYETEFYEFAEVFSEIYATIRERYHEEVGSKELFEGAINGMFWSLDAHSSYLPPIDQEMLTKDTEGEYSGVGLHITLDKDKVLTVMSPISGSPAGRLGVQPWDRIVEIDGESTKGITLMEAVKKLTGPTGAKVDVRIWREGESRLLEFAIKREVIHVQSAFSKIVDDDIGYLRIDKFQDDTHTEVKKSLKEFNREDVKGVIVDLRFNAGGLLDRAVEICDFFLDKGTLIVSTKGRVGADDERPYHAEHEKLCEQWLVVLVNFGSASASEIFAGAMQDSRRGIIIGPKGANTYGKGSVQTISSLKHSLERDENGDLKPAGMRLTTALYYTPSGKSIHDEKGIKPDIGVELPPGHERDLMMRGLLGMPSQIEPDAKDKNGNGDQGYLDEDAEDDQTAPEADDAEGDDEEKSGDDDQGAGAQDKDGDDLTQMLDQRSEDGDQGEADVEDEDFSDILLDEAIKYLKAILFFNQQKVT